MGRLELWFGDFFDLNLLCFDYIKSHSVEKMLPLLRELVRCMSPGSSPRYILHAFPQHRTQLVNRVSDGEERGVSLLKKA